MPIVILLAILLSICWMLHLVLRDPLARRPVARGRHTTVLVAFDSSPPAAVSHESRDDAFYLDDPPAIDATPHDEAPRVEADDPSTCHGFDSDSHATSESSSNEDVSCDSDSSDSSDD